VNEENEFDDYVKRDKSGHDDHAPLGQTELPDAKEHCRHYNTTGARIIQPRTWSYRCKTKLFI